MPARHAARHGAVEVRPLAFWTAPTGPVGNDWMALLLEAPEDIHPQSSEQFASDLCDHAEFGRAAGENIRGGAPLHSPGTATSGRC